MRKEAVAVRNPVTGGVLQRRALMLALLGLVGLAFAGSVSAEAERTVRMTGTERFVPNAMVQATLRFTPGPLTVASGDTVTWSDRSGAPHTITVIDAATPPATRSSPHRSRAAMVALLVGGALGVLLAMTSSYMSSLAHSADSQMAALRSSVRGLRRDLRRAVGLQSNT